MQGVEIFLPFIGMLILTFVVWVFMYVRRLHFIARHNIDAQQLTIPEKGAKLIPERISWPSYNFKNLFELPVIFYALCLYLFATANVDQVHVISAWLFLTMRVIHSVIHCTVNIVKLRFIAYVLAALVLWFMVFRVVIDVIL